MVNERNDVLWLGTGADCLAFGAGGRVPLTVLGPSPSPFDAASHREARRTHSIGQDRIKGGIVNLELQLDE